jgi:hypothetical protein
MQFGKFKIDLNKKKEQQIRNKRIFSFNSLKQSPVNEKTEKKSSTKTNKLKNSYKQGKYSPGIWSCLI